MRKRVGLVLSGGAARGFAHIGVLKVLQENDIPIDCVTGASVGSIVGALFCGGYRWDEIREIAAHLRWNELVQPTLSGLGLVKAERLERFVNDLLGGMSFEELAVPFKVVAVDIVTAKEVVFDSGPVARAVRASSSIPGIFEPVIEGDRAFVDGGVVNNLPCALARTMGARKTVAVDLNADAVTTGMPENLLDVSYRSFAILLDSASAAGRKNADILIRPDLRGCSYHDLAQADSLFERGVTAAEAALKRLEKLK